MAKLNSLQRRILLHSACHDHGVALEWACRMWRAEMAEVVEAVTALTKKQFVTLEGDVSDPDAKVHCTDEGGDVAWGITSV